MCLYVSQGTKRRTAKQDITVYKYLVAGPPAFAQFHVSPYYRACLWIKGCTRNSKLNRPYKGAVNEGLHAYLHSDEALRATRTRALSYVIEMIIPKGSDYIIGRDGVSVAATRLHWPK